MAYRYIGQGNYLWLGDNGAPGVVFRFDNASKKQKCDPKSGTIPCGDVCRLPANCRPAAKGFRPQDPPPPRDPGLGEKLKHMGSAVVDRVADRHFQEHMATHLAENVSAWAIGRVGGSALAKVAEAHGINPEVAQIGGEAIVQALAGTAIKAIVEKERDPKKLALGLAAELGAAVAGKISHHEVEHLVQEGGSKLAQFAGPLLAGKGAGIGTNQAVSKGGKKMFRMDSLGSLSESDLETLWMLTILGLSVHRPAR